MPPRALDVARGQGARHEPRRPGGLPVACVCLLFLLTCLAPEIVEAILAGRQPKGLRLAEMLGNRPLGWQEQRRNLALPVRRA
jgi:hypothetical protein